MDNAPQFRSGATLRAAEAAVPQQRRRRFVEIGRTAGDGFALEKVGRGLAAGDIDNDGDLDLLVTNNGQTADLLRNDGATATRCWCGVVALRLRSGQATATRSVRACVYVGGRTQVREVRAGSSYLSQNDLRLHFGLGDAAMVDRLEVTWPSQRVDVVTRIAANQIVTIQEGRGLVSRVPFVR